MKSKIWILLIFALGVSAMSCEQKKIKDREEIFDLESFINKQISLLADANYKLDKKTAIGDSLEQVTVIHDSAGWAKELSIFKTADIHKPGLRDYYERSDYTEKNYRIEEYVVEDSSQSRTVFLKIIYLENSGQIHRIEALQHTKNPIYFSKRNLYLELNPADHKEVLLDTFAIKGFQKMIMQDTVDYISTGKLKP